MGKTQRRAQSKGGGSNKNLNNDHRTEDSKKSQKGNKTGRKGRGGWSSQLETELSNLGLRVHEVAADGSCFFRSLADQLQGQAGDHRQLRKSIVQHIASNRELYEPFIEDDEPFDDYIERMAEEGTWAGNLELQAASIQLQVNLKIYQAGQPPWIVKNFPPEDVPMLHISYHDGMHYNSVRLLDDYGTGPPEPIVPNSIGTGTISNGGGTGGGANSYSASDLRRVKDGTGCEDDALVVVALERAGGNVDAAIEALVEQLHGQDDGGGDGDVKILEEGVDQEEIGITSNEIEVLAPEQLPSRSLDALNAGVNGEFNEKIVEVELEVSRGGKGKRVKLHLHLLQKEERGNNEKTNEDINTSSAVEEHGDAEADVDPGKNKSKTKPKDKNKKGDKSGASKSSLPARNSRCPCGSTKKYKNCCGGSKAARARTTQTNNNTAENQDLEDAAGVAKLQTLYI